MTCDRLVCANCAGPVSEGRCSVCRAQRERLQLSGPLGVLSPAVVALLLALAALVAFLAQRMATA
jgi:predicted RNA-binding protein with PUA domain